MTAEVRNAPPAPARPRRTGVRARLADLLLTLGAIAGVLCVLVAVAAYAFQVHLVVFRTGSMSPAIGTGALAVSRTVPAGDLAVGDVVTVHSATGQRVTHRIQQLSQGDDGARLVLRGDANDIDDAQPYDVTEADRVIASVPQAGYVVAWLSGPVGIFGGGLLVGLTLLIAFGRGTAPDPDGTPSGVSGVTAAALVLGLGVAMAGVVSHRDTLASWTDAGRGHHRDAGDRDLGRCAGRTPDHHVHQGQRRPGQHDHVDRGDQPDDVRGPLHRQRTHPAEHRGHPPHGRAGQRAQRRDGSFYLVAITSGGTSVASNLVSYSGTGNGKVCTVG